MNHALSRAAGWNMPRENEVTWNCRLEKQIELNRLFEIGGFHMAKNNSRRLAVKIWWETMATNCICLYYN